MKRVSRKLGELENCVLEPIVPGSTKISMYDIPESEQKLFEKFEQIAERFNPEDELSPELCRICETAAFRIHRRILDLFESHFSLYWKCRHEDDPIKWLFFTLRLHWFIYEMGRHMKQMEVEEDISRKHKRWKNYEKAWKEYEASLEDKTPLWTRESFKKFSNEIDYSH